MTEYCRNCSSELFAGQRFCRACGAPTEPLPEEQAAARMMPPQPEDWGARRQANTAPSSPPDTSPVYPPPSEYQPTAPMYPQVVPPYTPPRSRSRVGWIIAFIGIGLFVAVVFAVMIVARIGHGVARRIQVQTQSTPPGPQVGETALTESTADQVLNLGSDTTLTKTFALADGARLTITNINGSIIITAWDEPKAEVTITKRAGDSNSQVFFNNSPGSLALRTGQTGRGQDVRYEVKLPREMGRVDLNLMNGSIKISDVGGTMSVAAANGSIELSRVSGQGKFTTVNGKIKAQLEELNGPLELTDTNGSIEVTTSPDIDANLEATTVHGSINIDDQFGVTVQKEIVGQHARGQIGSGGPPFKVTTVNGSIKLAKQ